MENLPYFVTTLLARAYEGGEQADGKELTPGMGRKVRIELAGRRATLAETGEWIELLRLYVRDLLSFEIDARGDGTHTMQQSATLKAETMRASDKMDSCNIRAALQIQQTDARAPQNRQTAAEVHSLVAVDADDQDIEDQKAVCSCQAGCCEICAPTGEAGEKNGQGCCTGG